MRNYSVSVFFFCFFLMIFNKRLPPQPVVEEVAVVPLVDEEDIGSRSNKKPSRALRNAEWMLT